MIRLEDVSTYEEVEEDKNDESFTIEEIAEPTDEEIKTTWDERL